MGTPDDPRVTRAKARYNGAPSQEHWSSASIPRPANTGWTGWRGVLFPTGSRKPVPKRNPSTPPPSGWRRRRCSGDAYAKRRCIVPIDNFFEWKAMKGAKAKQPYAIAMKSGEPFGIAGIWESWKHPVSGEVLRTFCIVTTEANALVADIHDRMPVILPPEAYDRWLANIEPDPRDLLVPFPAELMMMWPISTRVNKPDNDDPIHSRSAGACGGRVTNLAVRPS